MLRSLECGRANSAATKASPEKMLRAICLPLLALVAWGKTKDGLLGMPSSFPWTPPFARGPNSPVIERFPVLFKHSRMFHGWVCYLLPTQGHKHFNWKCSCRDVERALLEVAKVLGLRLRLSTEVNPLPDDGKPARWREPYGDKVDAYYDCRRGSGCEIRFCYGSQEFSPARQACVSARKRAKRQSKGSPGHQNLVVRSVFSS